MKLEKITKPEPTLLQLAQVSLSTTGCITIEGRALDREIFIEGKQLQLDESISLIKEYSKGFNWGFGGSGSTQLAAALLLVLNHHDNKEATVAAVNTLLQPFKMSFVVHLPSDNFKAIIHYKEWEQRLLSKVTGNSSKPVHAFAFLELEHTASYYNEPTENMEEDTLVFSKFLDLPYLPFKQFVFKEGSVQYKELEKIKDEGKLWVLNNYYSLHSKRKSTRGIKVSDDGKEIKGNEISIKIAYQNNAYVSFYGLGRGTFYGHNTEDYNHIKS